MVGARIDQIFEDVVNTVREPILVLDSDLRILFANRNFYDSFKVTPEETLGNLIYNLGNRQWDIPRLRILLEEILPKDNKIDDYKVEHEFSNIGRKIMLLNARCIIQKESGSQMILLAIEDISERRQLKSLIEGNEEKYRDLVQNANSIILKMDPNGKVTFFNEFAQRFFGYTEEEILGRNVVGTILPEIGSSGLDLDSMIKEIGINPEKFITNENENMRRNGGRVWVAWANKAICDGNGKVIEILCIGNDITERRQMETLLSESEERYRRLFETANDGILLLDKCAGNITHANPAVTAMLGYSKEECIGGKLQDIGFSHDMDNFQKIMHTLDTIGIIQYDDVPAKTKAGQTLFVDMYLVDRASLVQCNIRNITESKKLLAELLRAQKLESIGVLAGGIAHDFNNILSAIIGYSELAYVKIETDSEVKAYIQGVLTAAERAKSLVKQIMAFSRQDKEEKRPVQIGLIVKEVLKFIRASVPTTIDIRENIQSRSLILADPTRIHQVLMNLCTNAAHAMREKGGILEVTLSDVEIGSGFASAHPEIQPGFSTRLTISDTGHGMTPQVMGRIFDPFFTTKIKGEGTGLGLSVVHGIVKDCGGIITVNSEPDKGTNFHLYFPVIESKVEEKPAKDTVIPTGIERILVVDDEASLVDIAQKILAALGYTVDGRTSSLEALKLFKAMPDKFDLVITDMTMPQMTGDRLAKALIKIRPDIPVILCTGFSEMITKERAEAMGIKAFLMKPPLKEEMAHTIRRVLDEAKGSTQGSSYS